VPAKKKKRGRIIGEGSSTIQEGGAQQNYVPPFGGIPAPPSYYGGVPMQAWGSDAALPPIKFCGAQRSLCRVIHTSSSTATKCDHYWRIRCKEHAKYYSHPNQCKPNGWRKCKHRLCAWTPSPSIVGKFIGGAVQSYYEQGYNNHDHQYQPPAED
jgi:hypothetical protein